MRNIRKFFDKIFEMNDQEWEYFSSKLAYMEFPKKSIILQRGKTERFLSFMVQGIIRFNIPKDDYDFTFGFAFENSFFSAYDSFINQSISTYNIEAITNCVLWRISYEDLQLVYRHTSCGERIGRMIAEDLYCKKIKREISLLEDTAKKRYTDLIREQPLLIKFIPQKYLASYIGVRPQSLSRIRKTI